MLGLLGVDSNPAINTEQRQSSCYVGVPFSHSRAAYGADREAWPYAN